MLDAVAVEVLQQGRLRPWSDGQADVVDVAAILSRRAAAESTQGTVDRHQVDERGARSQLYQSFGRRQAPLQLTTENLAVKVQHGVKTGSSEDHMVQTLQLDHDDGSLLADGSF